MFCKNCGKEVDDSAYVCTGCGCLVNGGARNSVSANDGIKTGKGNLLLKIFLIISFVSFCCTLFWGAAALAGAEVYFYVSGSYSDSAFYLNGGCVILMLLCSFIALGTAITAFIFGMKEKQEPALKMLTVLNFILSITALLVAFFFTGSI